MSGIDKRHGLLRRIDVRISLLVLIVLIVVILHSQGILLAALSIISLAIAGIARLRIRDVGRMIVPLVSILIITVLAQYLYDPSDALVRSITMVVRLLCIMLLSLAFMRTTDTFELIQALSWFVSPLTRCGIRADAFVLSLGIALNFIPVLFNEFAFIKKAQIARGMEFDSLGFWARIIAYRDTLGPLARSSFRHADSLADALVARNF